MLTGVEVLIAACARDHQEAIRSLTAMEPRLRAEMLEQGGTLLAEFSRAWEMPRASAICLMWALV